MTTTLADFTAPGAARDVSRRIEDYAKQRQVVSALVVPWESTDEALTMAVTSIHSEGWAIEHTNLGTIQLTGLDERHTRVAILAESPEHADRDKLEAMLRTFAGQLQDALQVADDDTPAR